MQSFSLTGDGYGVEQRFDEGLGLLNVFFFFLWGAAGELGSFTVLCVRPANFTFVPV